MKKVYVSKIISSSRRGRSVVRWKDRVKEYIHERVADKGGIELARRECLDRERWRPWPSLLGTFAERTRRQKL